ncbi:MAG: hypothetical protein P1S46_00685 [bacterium]|nr:hypothetical protein [bacterium]MDT8395523.1 hypothetical protein [bacterium]
MRRSESGQSLTETAFLTALVSLGAIGSMAVCHERIVRFIDLILSVIASPAP